jgi:hypothetical protein
MRTIKLKAFQSSLGCPVYLAAISRRTALRLLMLMSPIPKDTASSYHWPIMDQDTLSEESFSTVLFQGESPKEWTYL